MHCQICSSSESPSLLDMRGQFFMFKDQRIDLLSCFNLSKQIKIENEQNAKICESCQPKLIAEYISKNVKYEASITDQQSIIPITEFKTEPELNIETEWIFKNETICDSDVKSEVVVPKSENQTDEAVSSYQIIFSVHEVKEEPELQIEDEESVKIDHAIKTGTGVVTEHANGSLITVRENHKKSSDSEFSTAKTYKSGVCTKILKTGRNLSDHLSIHEESKHYQCHQCYAIFKIRRDLYNHKTKEHLENRFKCLYCVKTFKLKTNMIQHMDTHSDLKKYPCEHCSEAYNTKSKLLLHFHNIHSTIEFQCHYCSAVKPSKDRIRRHLLSHFQGTHKCPHCEKIFKGLYKLTDHQLICNKDFKCSQVTPFFNMSLYLNKVKDVYSAKILKCLLCVKTFSSMKNLTRHIESHSVLNKYPCKHCSEAFNTRGKLSVHFQNIHSILKFQCHHCSAIMKSKSSIQMHLMSHFEGKHKCTHCEKKFKTIRNLVGHQFIHTVTKNFKCSQCTATFKLPFSLKNHVQNVHSAKRFECFYCVKSFKAKAYLIRHMDFHSDLKKYQCKDCSLAFNTKAKLRSHFKNIHLSSPEN